MKKEDLIQFGYRLRVFWTQWFIELICRIFQTALISSYIKEKNIVLLEVVPRVMLKDVKKTMEVADGLLTGKGDEISQPKKEI